MSKPFCVVTDRGETVSITRLASYAAKQDDGKSQIIPKDNFAGIYGEQGLVQPPYIPDLLMSLMDINTYNNRCCKVKARDAAGIGYVISGLEKSNDAVKSVLDSFDLPFSEIIYRMMLDVEIVGYGAIEIVRSGMNYNGDITQLNHMPAYTLRRHVDGVRVQQRRGAKHAWFRMAGEPSDINVQTGELVSPGSIPPEKRGNEVVWIVNYSPKTDLYGEPDFIPAIGTISGDFHRREYNSKFFENFGVPSYAVFITGNYDPGEEDERGETELEKSIKEHFADVAANPHKTLIMSLPTRSGEPSDIEIKFQPLATDVKEASFRLYRMDNKDEVLAAHGVDPYRLGIAEIGSLSGNTADRASTNYKTSVIEPRQSLIEKIITSKIVKQIAPDATFEIAEIDIEDESAEMELTRSLYDMGAISSAEIRLLWSQRMNIDPDMPDDMITPSEIEKAIKSIMKESQCKK